MSLWYNSDLVAYKGNVASIVKNYIYTIFRSSPNSQALMNDSKTQEEMIYWSIAHSSHQNFHGTTGGVEFLCRFVWNLQIPDPRSPDRFVRFDQTMITGGLESFLNDLTVPYLVPEKVSNVPCNFASISKLDYSNDDKHDEYGDSDRDVKGG